MPRLPQGAKIARKDLIVLYNISYPTLQRWLQRAGLTEFNRRRKFFAHELVLIFQAIGRPQLARTAAQRLKDVYIEVMGLVADELRYKEQFGEEMPKQRQDKLEDSYEEMDAPAVYPLEKMEKQDARRVDDAMTRLVATAIFIKGRKARLEQASSPPIMLSTKGRKRKSKLKFSRPRLRSAS